MVKNVYWSLWKVPLIAVKFKLNVNFPNRFSNSTQIRNFMENQSTGSRVVPCGQKDTTKLRVAFLNFARAPKNWETTQWPICHYELLSQFVGLKEAMNRQPSFCFNAASGTLHENLRRYYCCRRQICYKSIVVKYSIFLYTWQWHVTLQRTQKVLLLFNRKNG